MYAASESQRLATCNPSGSTAATWITAGWFSPPSAWDGILATMASYASVVRPGGVEQDEHVRLLAGAEDQVVHG